jgi:hypothetical protein
MPWACTKRSKQQTRSPGAGFSYRCASQQPLLEKLCVPVHEKRSAQNAKDKALCGSEVFHRLLIEVNKRYG